MVVGIESWKDLRTSLMKDVHGFHGLAPQSLSCRPQAVRRTNSLNSIQSLCSTNFSSDDDNNFSTGFLGDVPLPPDEDAEEDWRMFGWLLDSADASTSMLYTSDEESKPRLYSPLPPLEIPLDASLPEASDLLKIKRKRLHPNKPLGTFTDQINGYRDPQCRKRCSISTDDEFDSEEEEEEIFESRAMTRSMAHYLELKRRRKIGAPMPEETVTVKTEPKIEVEDTYVYEEPARNEYSMDSECIDNSAADITEQYMDTSGLLANIKSELVDSTESSSSRKGKVEVIRGVKGTDGKRQKPGRPTTKQKRQIERENKKILKKQKQDLSQDLQQFCGTKTCYCQKMFDPSQDHIKCSSCKQLFHPKCAKTTLSKVEKLSEWYCNYCNPNDPNVKTEAAESTEEILCICNQPYSNDAHWIGCNLCDKWFHPECVQTTIEAVQLAGEYICSECAFQRVLHRENEEEEQIQQNEDGVYYA